MFLLQRLVMTALLTCASVLVFMAIGSGVTLWILGNNSEKVCQMVQSKSVLDWFSDGKK